MIQVKVYYGKDLLTVNEFRSQESSLKFLRQIAKGRSKVFTTSLSPKFKIEITNKK